ncbi:unnamed protein product [Notodromas monacha]|uniref:Uncharacterized protein n=1 Tax=Notodromas monacha TaxID=399045 RepID=A0A7R9GJU2_9CRUS|nr:unnamed protein product [Notodromas monacha]CAG0924040.1 unnamed protein product [Notodromas monacha]
MSRIFLDFLFLFLLLLQISLNGYIGFSDHLRTIHGYPLHFPTETWPEDNDPAFIGPFFSECRIGKLRGDERDLRKPGIYYRVERDLRTRKDRFGFELHERLLWDIREGMIGAEIFDPKHAFIVTWKNVTFNGGQQPRAQYVTNTFQAVIATDEVMTYAIMNYEHLGWTTHTGAGGSTDDGQGGTPAFVGFNAGNGTRAYEYLPYSQRMQIRDLPSYGGANGKLGRHIFRIDEHIFPGSCNPDPQRTNLPLFFAPESGNMLGGTVVNVTGPCFTPKQRVTCRFEDWEVEGIVRDANRATCITPPGMKTSGYIDFLISQDGGPFYWKGKFFIETPMTAPEGVWFDDMNYQLKEPERLNLKWDWKNLTYSQGAQESLPNRGELEILPADFLNRRNLPQLLDITVGLLQVNLTNPVATMELDQTPVLWSRPIPLAWYFGPQWKRKHGKNWAESMCQDWINFDREMKLFAYEVPKCPCLIRQAIASKAFYVPDFSCDKDGNTQCYFHQGAQHCIRTGMANKDAAGQQCCYDRDGYLMMTTDNKWGGNPQRAHNQGMMPYIEANKVPSLSHWALDVSPFYMCCMWQDEQSDGCETYRFERRHSQDCVGFQPPGAAKREYRAMQASMTAGIVLAVLIPIVVLAVCLVVRYRRSGQRHGEYTPNYAVEVPAYGKPLTMAPAPSAAAAVKVAPAPPLLQTDNG